MAQQAIETSGAIFQRNERQFRRYRGASTSTWQLEAEFADSLDPFGSDLPAEPLDTEVDHAAVAVPYITQQRVSVQNDSGIRGELQKEPQLRGGERQQFARLTHFEADGVNRQVAENERGRLARSNGIVRPRRTARRFGRGPYDAARAEGLKVARRSKDRIRATSSAVSTGLTT